MFSFIEQLFKHLICCVVEEEVVTGLGEDIVKEVLEEIITNLAKASISEVIDKELAKYHKQLRADFGIE